MHGGPGGHWRRRWMHKGMEDMTPEERERFEHGIHSHPHSEEKA
jgi:hypothetical protein